MVLQSLASKDETPPSTEMEEIFAVLTSQIQQYGLVMTMEILHNLILKEWEHVKVRSMDDTIPQQNVNGWIYWVAPDQALRDKEEGNKKTRLLAAAVTLLLALSKACVQSLSSQLPEDPKEDVPSV